MIRSHVRLALFALALGVLPLSAQARFGIVGGLVSSKTSIEFEGDNTSNDEKSLMDFAAGFSMQRGMGALTFAPEALFLTKGIKYDPSEDKLKMTYLEVPLLFRYTAKTTGKVAPFVTAGPSVAFQLSCKVVEDGEDSESCDDFYGEESSYKKLDVGAMVGAGFTAGKLSVSARYDLGLTNIDKADGYNSKNKALMLLVGYQF